MASIARDTLNAARRFLHQGAAYGVEDPAGFADNVNAAIVFGRSVTWHIQKAYKHRAGFDEWYADEQRALKYDKLCRFFHESRTKIKNFGLAATRRRYSVLLEEGLYLSEWPEAEAFLVRPWYRRTLQEYWQALARRARKLVNALRIRLRRQARSLKERWAPRRSVGGSVNLYFDDPSWNQTPVFELVKQYLDILDGVVDRAERRFESKP